MCMENDLIGVFVFRDFKDEPYVGIFLVDKPCLILRDFDLISRVLKQDFYHFNNRIIKIPKKSDPIGARRYGMFFFFNGMNGIFFKLYFFSLFSIHGTEWKNTRSRVSPIFTTKKQKAIFDALLGVGQKFDEILKKSNRVEKIFVI